MHKPLSHDSASINNDELDAVIERFFRNLFPLAYHHAVHSQTIDKDEDEVKGKSSSSSLSTTTSTTLTTIDMASRDFHVDYKNCLTNSYDTLQPFGDIPYSISRSLVQSVSSASTLLKALQHGADVLTDIENLPIESSLSTLCKHALLKMDYCSACKGHNYHHLKPCYGYCSNVMRYVCVCVFRCVAAALILSNQKKYLISIKILSSFIRGCLTQLVGGIDNDWASFSEAIERLMTFVRNKDGIESVIKSLDGKLSEAIMHAMTNGPDLEKKVSE